MLARAAEHHAEWTGESYAAVAAVALDAVLDRTAQRPTRTRRRRVERPRPDRRRCPGAVVRRSPLVRFVEVSQVVGDTVRLAPASSTPEFDGAVAYVAGTPVVPLLAPLDGVATIGDLVGAWAEHDAGGDGGRAGAVVAPARCDRRGRRVMSDPLEALLARLGLERLGPLFAENEVDLDTLRILSEADLQELGIPFGPRKKLLNALADARVDGTGDGAVDGRRAA